VVIATTAFLLTALVQSDSTPQDTTQRSRTTVLPVVSYSETTGLQYGAALFRGFRVAERSGTRPSSVSLYAAFTAKKHAKAYAQLDRWSDDNATRSRARVEYMSYPFPFFGVGRSTPDSAEEWYSSGVTTGHFFVERQWRRSLFVHGGLRYTQSRLREFEAGGVLDQRAVPGATGSDVVAASFGIVVDSRNDVGAPSAGTYTRIIPAIASKVFDTDAAFRRLTVDARRYAPLGAHVLAVQIQYDGLNGTAPFDLMPMIGADTALRGYPRGRFRDQHAFTSQVELRSARWRRFGAVAFGGAGTVAPRLSEMTRGAWFPTFGAGARYLLSPRYRTIVRADLAVGRSSFGIHLGIGEAF
jgi:outer membrane protein assembly factor BamA